MVTLPAAWCYLIVVAAIAIGALEGFRLAGQQSLNVEDLGRRAPYLYIAIPLCLLAVVGDVCLNRDPDLQWHVPEWWLAHYVPVSRGATLGVLTLVFALGSVVSFRNHDARRWLTVVLGVVFISTFLGWQYQHAQSVDIGPPRISDFGMILQSNASTCVAATGANIANHFGIEESEADMVKLYGTTAQGTSPGQVIYGMTQLGLNCHLVNSNDLLTVHPPAMLFVDSNQGVETHSVALMEVKHGRVLIWDPAHGPFWATPGRVANGWHGHALEFSRQI